jgi:geranylgeranyl pyrophosphate synthase
LDWVWEYIHLTSDDQTRRLDLSALRDEVDTWFASASLEQIMGAPEGTTEQIARQWLERAGKRWRPFLSVAAFQALRNEPGAPLPEDIRKIAVAVECFHKASLIHDDIEDNDKQRYGEKTLHEEFGVPVALNVGDLLIGEGYRLLAECQALAAQKAAMLHVASQGQRQLCRGQGAELTWARQPEPLSVPQVLDIFRRKTAPAFEVALRVGAIYAGLDKHDQVGQALGAYSEALGIAYQIRDDLSDLGVQGENTDLLELRPSLLLAIAHERAEGEEKNVLASVWRRTLPKDITLQHVSALCLNLKADERARILLETYKEEIGDYQKQKDKAESTVNGILLRLREKTR